MQTILGSGGAIGSDLAKELKSFTDHIRLVSRNPRKMNENDEIISVDLTNFSNIDNAVSGSEVVYVTIGFEYKTRVWQQTWPPFMMSVIEACQKHGSKLVFFDNMYLYDSNEITHMTENSKINPSSKKGKVRAEIFEMIMKEVRDGGLTAIIARAADFYGPGIGSSVLQEMVLKNLKEGKAAYWFANGDKKHSFTYTPDAAKATALLGNTSDAYNQVWHLPTHHETLTGRQWVKQFAKELSVKPKIKVMPSSMLTILGFFTPVLKEFKEMTYQWDREYFFDSSKFEKKFGFSPTTYADGIKEVVKGVRE